MSKLLPIKICPIEKWHELENYEYTVGVCHRLKQNKIDMLGKPDRLIACNN